MLIYMSYAMMDIYQAPAWVPPLLKNQRAMEKGFVFHNPETGIIDHLKNPQFVQHMNNDRINKVAKDNAELFRLEPMTFEPLPPDLADEKFDIGASILLRRFVSGDTNPDMTNLVFKDLYILLRSDLLLVDMNTPSHGGKPMEVLYAYLWKIPIIGINFRFTFSPWIATKLNCMISPNNSEEIVDTLDMYLRKE